MHRAASEPEVRPEIDKAPNPARHAPMADAFGLPIGWRMPGRRQAPFVRTDAGDVLSRACEQAVQQERVRLLNDLHDGCGGHLVTALRLVEHGAPGSQVAAALRDCIDDLRLVLDALDPEADDLLPMLASLRDRTEVRLSHLGIRLDWPLDALPALPRVDARWALQILRILQEAFTNVIKHASARHLWVETTLIGAAPAQLQLRIRDDGIGLRETGEGRGLPGMRRRAAQFGGTLHTRSDATGTVLELTLPLARC